jgi:hypothetical protein
MSIRYILTGYDASGARFSDAGLTEAQVQAAQVNAPRMGITIDEIIEEPTVTPQALRAFGVAL